MVYKALSLLALIAILPLSAEEDKEPPKIGNFALPSSQQPSGLFSFVGNVIDKDEIQVYFFADEFVGRDTIAIHLDPYIVFGITDTLSISFDFPSAPLFRDGRDRSSGIADTYFEIGYAFYNRTTKCYSDQAILIAHVAFPTGSVKKNPNTGFGAPSFFLGATYYRMMVDWFVFGSYAGVLTTANHRTKIGEQFLYEFGFGKNIPSPKGWIYAWMFELDGCYARKNRIHGCTDHNSGGNTIYATPSLWISSKDFLMQFGVSFPVNQNLFGSQKKYDYALNFAVAWSFY